MPNWVTNRIVFHGDQENIDRVLQYIKGNGSKIDFNKIIPMPDNIYRGDLGKRELTLGTLLKTESLLSVINRKELNLEWN